MSVVCTASRGSHIGKSIFVGLLVTIAFIAVALVPWYTSKTKSQNDDDLSEETVTEDYSEENDSEERMRSVANTKQTLTLIFEKQDKNSVHKLKNERFVKKYSILSAKYGN